MEPVCKYETQEMLNANLKWWQEKLFLNDWIITAKIIAAKDFDLQDSCGENILNFEQKTAVIHILSCRDVPESFPVKYCQEKILVHELLHCKYNFVLADDSYEQKYLDVMDHQKLEEMAKTLIMLKYDIPFSWFMK